MGVVNATGIVLKATRSWQTPTSSYTLFLPGYLFAANRVSTVSVSAKVVSVPTSGTVAVEYNAFTSTSPMNGSPATDADAFQQSLQRIVTSPKKYKCMLCDEYGTPYGITAELNGVDLSNELEFSDASFDGAVAGDIIMMDFASNAFTTYPEDLEACWDAFQADAAGLVNSDAALSYPWVR
jgi:hypothetical protein